MQPASIASVVVLGDGSGGGGGGVRRASHPRTDQWRLRGGAVGVLRMRSKRLWVDWLPHSSAGGLEWAAGCTPSIAACSRVCRRKAQYLSRQCSAYLSVEGVIGHTPRRGVHKAGRPGRCRHATGRHGQAPWQRRRGLAGELQLQLAGCGCGCGCARGRCGGLLVRGRGAGVGHPAAANLEQDLCVCQSRVQVPAWRFGGQVGCIWADAAQCGTRPEARCT